MKKFYPEKLIYERVSPRVMKTQSTLAAHADSVIHFDSRMLNLTSQTAQLCQDPFVNPLIVLFLYMIHTGVGYYGANCIGPVAQKRCLLS